MLLLIRNPKSIKHLDMKFNNIMIQDGQVISFFPGGLLLIFSVTYGRPFHLSVDNYLFC
jgi:hypothetical protein